MMSKQDDLKMPATEVMMKVAEKTADHGKMKKAFSMEEIEEIMARRDEGETISADDQKKLNEQYRKIKRRVKEMEKGNHDKLIVVPSIKTNDGFYKVFGFSALYYVYRLANRMGRNARLMNDTDKFSKTLYSASLVDIDKFIEQIKRLENPKVELCDDGVYIFTLKKPLTDDEVGELRLIEETRREKLHNVLRPAAMDPAAFQGILMVARQVAPRVRKLEKQYYYAIGEDMLKNLNMLLATYFDYAAGVLKKDEASKKMILLINRMFAALAILSETRVWDYGVAASIGENINEVKRIVVKTMGMKI